jgi:radical SAM superfamily enzyme YgiQ (UPF0313 family)
MFDRDKANVIILADFSDTISQQKTIGPYKVAQALRSAGFEVAVIHHLLSFTIEEICNTLQQLVNHNTVMIGVSNFFYRTVDAKLRDDGGVSLAPVELGSILPHGKESNAMLKDLVRDINPNTKWTLGGPTAVDKAYNKDFDYVVLGYADVSIVNLAQHLWSGSQLEKSYRSINGFTVINDAKAETYDFSNTMMTYQDHDVILPGETLAIEISRGCIFRCAFCSFPLNGKKKMDYIKNRDLLLAEFIDNYERFGVTRYTFADDTVNDSVQKCEMIKDISDQVPFDLEWWGYMRLDLMSRYPETMTMMFDSGCRAVHFGIETLNDETAKVIGKGGDRQRQIDTLRQIKQQWGSRVQVHGSFIYGLPRESLASLAETTDFLLSDDNPLDSWRVAALNIRPLVSTAADDGAFSFISEIEKNYHKYGYVVDPSDTTDPKYYNHLLWRNEHTDYVSMVEHTRDLQQQGFSRRNNPVDAMYALTLAGLDLSLDKFINRPFVDIDWHALDQIKAQRAREYKLRLWQSLDITITAPEVHDTFGDFLKHTIIKDATTAS